MRTKIGVPGDGRCSLEASDQEYSPNETGRALSREKEGESIDTKTSKSGPTPGETETAAKTYCKSHPSGIINLRSYSGDWYQQSCTDLAARLQATSDPSYKLVPD